MLAHGSHLGLELADRYRIEEVLAHGALCPVYRGQDTVLRRSIAVKVVPPEHVHTYREALRRTAALTHPTIVATYDALEEGGQLFLIQEHVPARPFQTYLRNGLPVERALGLAGQVARALAYAHAHDIIHGDLTPTALLVDRRALVRVNNYCLPPGAAYFHEFSRALEHQAPGGLEDASPAEDVRALGLILWQALSQPTQDQDATEPPEDASRTFRPDVHESARVLVRRCVVRAHPERIRDAETLTLALEALAHDLAQDRSPLPETTPPALRVAREMIAQEAAWSLDDTLGVAQPWPMGAGMPLAVGEPFSNAPTSPATSPGQEEWEVAAGPFRDEVGVPRRMLPARPSAGAAPQGGSRLLVRSAPPRWGVKERGGTRELAMREGRGISLGLVLLFGLLLFALFFVLGFVLQPLPFGR